jgi:hypothetical protein
MAITEVSGWVLEIDNGMLTGWTYRQLVMDGCP